MCMNYGDLSDKYLENIICNIGDIIKELGKTMVDLSNIIGYNASTYSRNRNNVLKDGFKRESNMAYALNLLVGLDYLIFSSIYDDDKIYFIEKIIFSGMHDNIGNNIFKGTHPDIPIYASWYVINIPENKGFVYQWHELKKLEISSNNNEKIVQQKNDFIRALREVEDGYITIPGVLQLGAVRMDNFNDNSFQNAYSIIEIAKYIKRSICKLENIELKNINLHVSSLIKDEIYYGNMSNEYISNIDIITADSIALDENTSDFFIDIATLYENYRMIKGYKLLLVKNNKEYMTIKSTFSTAVTDKVIFSYISSDGNSIIFIYNDVQLKYPLNTIAMYNLISEGR